MKKAFSLFESIMALSVFVIVLLIISKPVLNMNHFYNKHKDLSQNIMNLNLSLLFIDKILKKCINSKFFTNSFSCTLSDDDILLLRKNQLLIAYSGIILKDEISSFYSPKSNFSYEEVVDGKKTKLGILENQKDLHGRKDNTLRLFSLEEKKEYKVEILDKEKISFVNDSFSGFYKVIDSEISLFLNDKTLFYKYNNIDSILLENVKDFSIEREKDAFKIRICQENLDCVYKWSAL